MMARTLGAVVVLVLALLVFPGAAGAQDGGTVTVNVTPLGGSSVQGTVVLSAAGQGTKAAVDLQGLKANAAVRVTMHAGTCATPSASFAPVADLTADAAGKASGSGEVLFQGREAVSLATMADGEHIISVSQDTEVACGVIGKLAGSATTTPAAPAQLPATGSPLMLPALLALLGLAGLGGGLVARARS